MEVNFWYGALDRLIQVLQLLLMEAKFLLDFCHFLIEFVHVFS